MIIGLTGTLSSGKDTIAEFLVKKGFKHISTGDIVREDLQKSGAETNRETLQQRANELRRQYGPDYLAKSALSRARNNAVISGLRTTSEVEALRQASGDGFVLLAVDAPAGLRYSRAKARGRIGDEITLEKFLNQEAREMHGTSPYEQQLGQVMAQANVTIENEGSQEDLYRKIEELLKQYA